MEELKSVVMKEAEPDLAEQRLILEVSNLVNDEGFLQGERKMTSYRRLLQKMKLPVEICIDKFKPVIS